MDDGIISLPPPDEACDGDAGDGGVRFASFYPGEGCSLETADVTTANAD